MKVNEIFYSLQGEGVFSSTTTPFTVMVCPSALPMTQVQRAINNQNLLFIVFS